MGRSEHATHVLPCRAPRSPKRAYRACSVRMRACQKCESALAAFSTYFATCFARHFSAASAGALVVQVVQRVIGVRAVRIPVQGRYENGFQRCGQSPRTRGVPRQPRTRGANPSSRQHAATIHRQFRVERIGGSCTSTTAHMQNKAYTCIRFGSRCSKHRKWDGIDSIHAVRA